MSSPLSQSLSKLARWRRQSRTRCTLGYCQIFLCIGMDVGVLGPTLPGLAAQTHSSLGDMGILFFAVAGGHLLGTVFGGRVFDHVRAHPVMAGGQLVSALLIALLPVVPSLWMAAGLLALKGFAEGALNNGANSLLIWTYGKRVGPYMNALHFFFGVGAFLSPIIAAQALEAAGGYRWVYWILAAINALVGFRLLIRRVRPRARGRRRKN
jgi:MFS transporter, FHS family, Na+ dependent glucose transporter 1